MTKLVALIFIGLAVLCAGVTFNASTNLPVQEGGAAAAVAFAIIAGVALYTSDPPESASLTGDLDRSLSAREGGAGAIEEAFSEGPFGRERIALTLDAIERATRHPDLPAASRDELERLRSLRPTEFHAYVTQRLERLERET